MIRMLDDRILIEPQENSDINHDGVVFVGKPTTTFVADADKANQICAGRVVSVGPGKRHKKTGRRMPLDVIEGDFVSFSDTCHKSYDEYLVIREADIMGKSNEPITAQVVY
jgi:co-chaperonin GroES (HSP10)